MANTISGGTPVAPVVPGTLAALVARWRSFLDDAADPYLWSDQELTDYCNSTINEMCREIPLIQDSSTASICTISVVASTHTYSVSDRIVKILRAKLALQSYPLPFGDIGHMDGSYSAWEAAASGSPTILLIDGVGTNKIRLYPTPSANDTLSLTVQRMPLADMTYATDSGSSPEIPSKHYSLLDNGIYYRAYSKQDADTFDQKKAMYHLGLYKKDFENIKRSMLKYTQRETVVAPLTAFS